MVASAPALWAGAWETASSGLDECPVREAFLTAQSPHPLDPSPSVRGLGRPRSPPSRIARARAGLQRRAFPGRGAGNPRMTGSGTAPSSARTSASRAGTFLGAAGRPRCLETHTLQDLPHCELSVVTGWVLRYSDLSFQCPCELRWGSKSRAWGLPGLADGRLGPRLRPPGSGSASSTPRGPPQALFGFFPPPFPCAPVSRLAPSTASLLSSPFRSLSPSSAPFCYLRPAFLSLLAWILPFPTNELFVEARRGREWPGGHHARPAPYWLPTTFSAAPPPAPRTSPV